MKLLHALRLRGSIKRFGRLAWEGCQIRFGLAEPSAINEITGFLIDIDKKILSKYTKALPERATIVEIGSFLGLSAAIMSATRRDCSIVCIDPCDLSGEEDSRTRYESLTAIRSLQYWKLRINLALYGAKVRVICATSQQALVGFSVKCHLLFVDGDHSYEGCLHDVNGYARHLVSGGTLILHDATQIGWPGPIKVAQQLANDPGWQFVEQGGNCMVFRRR